MFRNTVKTVVLLAGIGVLFMVVGSFFGTGGLVIGLALGIVFVGGSYWFSDKLAVKAAGAVPVTEAEQPKLYAIVRDLTSRTGMPMPAIYISPAAQPNAFATGRNPHHAAVAVTQGLLQIVDEDELRGVLAHELSHVANRDILISSVAAAVAMGITFMARMAMWGAIFGGVGRRARPRRQRVRRAGDDDPRPDRGGDAPDGALPVTRVRGRSQRRRAARQRRGVGPCAREDRRVLEAGADEGRPRAGDGLHHQPARGPQVQLLRPVPDAPAHRRAHRPPAPRSAEQQPDAQR